MYVRKTMIHRICIFATAVLLTTFASPQQHQISNLDRERAQDMLQVVAGEVRKHYYDPKFHGQDWDARVAEAKEKIAKADSMNMALSHIAAALDTLNDSHTFFLPPQHSARSDYGWTYQMVGDRCFVTHVRSKSDAEAKGVKAGDEILTLNGYTPSRENLWKMKYVFSVLRPQSGLRLGLQDPAGHQRQVDVATKIRERKRISDLTGGEGGGDIWDLVRELESQGHIMRARYVEYADQLLVLRVPEFFFSMNEVDRMIGKARKYPNLIIDLRGNPGGSVDTLKYLVSGTFDKEVKIADRVGRKERKPETAKAGHDPFTGKLAVLVDSSSGSAAEIFARTIQLEKRGIVVGDKSSGSVMEARHYNEKMGSDIVIFYGASITESDLIMADGKSLEHTGVTPDELALPTARDMADGRDPVMARAAELLGVKMTPEAAGKAFPYEWPPE
jgi:C-terminal processing protease CtpA/Prc